MWHIYILYSEKDEKLYVGCTSNLQKRLARHRSGAVLATRTRRPLKLIHQEEFQQKADAFQRERFLKSLWSARFKKKVLRGYLQSLKG